MELSEIFKRIGFFLSDKEELNRNQLIKEYSVRSEAGTKENESVSEQGSKSTKADNSSMEPVAKNNEPQIEGKEELAKSVCKKVSKYLDGATSGGNTKMIVWLDTEYLIFKTYDTVEFRQQLQSAMVNECGITFESVECRMGKPAEELRCTPVGKSGRVMMQVLENKPEKIEVHQKASISIFGNSGSLLKDEYILSSDEMREKSVPVYNIGAGEFPQVPTGYRQNHIAIDDNPNSPMVEKNKYVSRKHAHIGFSDEFGFYLQVEIDGTRLMGKRTRIFRGEKIIEMDNPQAKEALQDGDLIELGKAVTLRYFEIKNK